MLSAREGEQDANVEYWLRLIESFGGDSPVIVVINKIEDCSFDLNRRGLQQKFPVIRDFVHTDCDSGVGIDKLCRAITHETDRLEHLRDPFPASWFAVKDRLANLQQNHITYEQYQELCRADGITEVASQHTLVAFLHDLGIVVNFRDDPRLADTHVLNPHWVTSGIYHILNAKALAEKKGDLRREDLSISYDTIYPRKMYPFLLDLMEKFELCYEFYGGDGEYLVPELLGKEEPDLAEFQTIDALRFEYHYNILPEGLLPRLIVRLRVLNRDLPRWRTGVVIAFENNRAAVTADIQDKRLSIAVTGNGGGRRRLLAVIRSDLESIHRSITGLQAEEMVPIPSHPKVVVDYATLAVMEAHGEVELKLVVAGKVAKFDVSELLSGVEEVFPMRGTSRESRTATKDAVRIAFSYCHRDEELRDQLETHLKLLQRQGIVSTWHDRKIKPGEDWKGVIDENFNTADMILLLVSADFLASDYCYEDEMKTALERHRKADARVIPILLRDCKWQNAPFAQIQLLPKDGSPVTSWSNRDEAWTSVADGIEKAAKEVRRKRTSAF